MNDIRKHILDAGIDGLDRHHVLATGVSQDVLDTPQPLVVTLEASGGLVVEDVDQPRVHVSVIGPNYDAARDTAAAVERVVASVPVAAAHNLNRPYDHQHPLPGGESRPTVCEDWYFGYAADSAI